MSHTSTLLEVSTISIPHKYSAFGRTKISTSHLQIFKVKWLMDYTDSGSSANANTNKGGNVGHVTFSETFGTVEWIDPDFHLIFVKFIWKFIIVEISFRRHNPVYLFKCLEMSSIRELLFVIVVDKHFLTDCIFIQLVRHDVRF